MSHALPKGWAEVTLAELAAETKYPIGDGTHGQIKSSAYRAEGIPFIRVGDLGWGTFAPDGLVYIPEAVHQKNLKSELRPGDVLIAKIGATIGKCCIVPATIPRANTIASIGKVTVHPRLTSPKWVLYNFLTRKFKDQLWAVSHKTAQSNFSIHNLKQFTLPLAPFAEQQRIVAKLDRLWARANAGRERLEKIATGLRRLRRAIFAAANTGRLTADWRAKHPQPEPAAEFVRRVQAERQLAFEHAYAEAVRLKKRKPKPPKNKFQAALDETAEGLPAGWCATRIGDLSDCLDHARVPVNHTQRQARPGTTPYYGANGQAGWIDGFLFDEELVLVVEDEVFTGREIPFSYVVRGKSWVNNHAHVLRPLSQMPADYLNLCLSYYDFIPLTTGANGRRKLNQKALLNAPLWVAPLAEQHEIARRTRRLLALASRLEQRRRQAQRQMDKLTPALLAHAFAGKLTPQKTQEESAAALLKRVRQ